MKLNKTVRETAAAKEIDEDVRSRFGDAFGKIEEVQRSLPQGDTQLIRYLLDMAKLEIARRGTGLPNGALGRPDPDAAWLKALRDEEGDEPRDPPRPN